MRKPCESHAKFAMRGLKEKEGETEKDKWREQGSAEPALCKNHAYCSLDSPKSKPMQARKRVLLALFHSLHQSAWIVFFTPCEHSSLGSTRPKMMRAKKWGTVNVHPQLHRRLVQGTTGAIGSMCKGKEGEGRRGARSLSCRGNQSAWIVCQAEDGKRFKEDSHNDDKMAPDGSFIHPPCLPKDPPAIPLLTTKMWTGNDVLFKLSPSSPKTKPCATAGKN